MPKRSAGLLLHRTGPAGLEVLLVHPGGPFWAKKDDGAWSIPKGEHEETDDPAACAHREFEEELGMPVPASDEPDVDLGEIRLKSGKRVRGYARAGTVDVAEIRSNTFEQEWPPKSGRIQEFPEVDRAGWFPVDEAKVKLNAAQAELVDRLLAHLG